MEIPMLKTLFNVSLILSLTGTAIVLSNSPEPSSKILKFALDRSTLNLSKQSTGPAEKV
jgi:hypothetical protein